MNAAGSKRFEMHLFVCLALKIKLQLIHRSFFFFFIHGCLKATLHIGGRVYNAINVRGWGGGEKKKKKKLQGI